MPTSRGLARQRKIPRRTTNIEQIRYPIPPENGTSRSANATALVVAHVLKPGNIDGARVVVTTKTNSHPFGVGV
jgi:hypothetical protein